MKVFRIHYPQTNAVWIEVEAGTPQAALNKANKQIVEYVPVADVMEYPSGAERNLETDPVISRPTQQRGV